MAPQEIAPPEFALTKPANQWDEKEKKAYDEYEKKTKELTEEKEKHKKVLRLTPSLYVLISCMTITSLGVIISLVIAVAGN